jgi:3-hydroxyisobutyrate dehydrogenase-like beta-hydroxyacid dehydrogenase
MDERPRVGFAGLGLMGRGMARNLLDKGYPLTLLGHRRRGPIEELKARGAAEATSPAELAAANDVVILCVTSSAVVEDLIRRPDGILAGAHPGLTLIDCSTALPDSTRALGAELAARGAVMLDAPLARTPKEAQEGRLNCMVGGDPAVFERMRPVLAAFCENIVHVGPLGCGHQLKLVNNYLSLGNALIVAEAVGAASAAGLDLRKLFEIVSKGGANSAMFQMVMPYVLDAEPGAPQFSLANAHKDLGYFEAMAAAVGRPPVLRRAARRAYARLVEAGHGERMVPELFDLLGDDDGD